MVALAIVAYALSFGPACGLCDARVLDTYAVWRAYRPITWLCYNGGPIAHTAINWWVSRFSWNDGGPLFFEAQNSVYPY